jgi:signal transduction histidine kinase
VPRPSSSLRRRLLTVVLVSTLPIALCAAVALFLLLRAEENQAIARALEANRQTATAVRVSLNRSFAVLEAVAQSPLLDGDDLGPFEEVLERILPLMPGWHSLLLASPDGRVIDRVSPRPGERLLRPVEPSSFVQVLETGKPVVGPLGKGPSGVWAIPLRVPVMREGKPRYVITAPLLPESIDEVLTLPHLPKGWTVSVFDGNSRRIARMPSAELPVGDEVSAELTDLVRSGGDEGSGITHTKTGQEVYTAYIRLPDLNWTVATGIPTTEVKAKVLNATLLYGGGLLLSLALASLGALLAARRISQPMRELRNAATAIGRQQSPRLPNTQVSEIQAVVLAMDHSAKALAASEQERNATLTSLAAAHERLKEADQRKDEYIATLAHELRNPLAPITQAVALLRAAGLSAAQQSQSLAVIDRQTGNMSRLLDDLLDASRINFGTFSLLSERLDINTVLREAFDFITARARERRLDLRITVPDRPTYVEGDALRLQQLFVNLLDNAVKYTQIGGCIQLTARVHDAVLEIEVCDNGIGIANEHLQDIFRLFGRVASPGMESGGLGVGLALAKSLAEMHKGNISVTSAGHGQGSCFTVTLPLSDDQSQPETVTPSVIESPSTSRRIVVADDNRDIAQTLEALFDMEGHHIRVAYDGLQALDLCKQEMPEVAVLDIGMPNMDGHQAAQAIRALPGGEAVFLIALSGWGRPEDVDAAVSSGFDRHLTKPADLIELLEMVASA